MYLYVINAYRIMFYVVIAGLFDCVISVFAMFLYIYFGKNKNQYDLTLFSYNRLELRNLHVSKKGQVTN